MSPSETSVAKYDDPGIVATIKATVAKGANDHELQMFLQVCKGTGLNPFLKEIWFVKDNNGRLMIMAARDGYLRVANESPLFDGMETKVERDNNGIPVKAVCTVWRKDRSHPITCEAYYNEYKKASPVWNQYPSAMLSKVAEVLALKRSFSINGVVTEEEIGDGEAQSNKAAHTAMREAADARQEARLAAEQASAELKKHQDLPASYKAGYYEGRKDEKELVYEPVPEALELPDAGLGPPHDQQLVDSLIAFPPKKAKSKLSTHQIDVVKIFGPLKDGYTAIGMEERYYEVLAKAPWKKKKSTDFKDQAEAQPCINYMQLDLQECEVWVKQQGNDDGPAA